MEILKIMVIGAGTMGNGIAHCFAQYGYQTYLIDINQDSLEKALISISNNLDRQIKKEIINETDKNNILKNIHTSTKYDLFIKEVDIIIEAVSENETLKLNLFKELSLKSKPETILASNTSSISITKIAAVTDKPDKVIGMHFMNPVPVMKLVEIITGLKTSDQTTQTIISLTEKIEKTPIMVNDYPGFVANRILMPMINEAIYALYEGVAEKEAIDSIMKLGMAHPMGPLQLADYIGLDVCMAILNVLYDGFKNPKYAPCPLLVNKVNANELGVKTKKGFYTY